MSMARERCCLMVPLAIPSAVELSTWMGVGGCGCPISSRIVRSVTASFMFLNSAPTSASTAEETTTSMVEERLRMGPLNNSGAVVVSLPRKKWPPARLRACGSLR